MIIRIKCAFGFFIHLVYAYRQPSNQHLIQFRTSFFTLILPVVDVVAILWSLLTTNFIWTFCIGGSIAPRVWNRLCGWTLIFGKLEYQEQLIDPFDRETLVVTIDVWEVSLPKSLKIYASICCKLNIYLYLSLSITRLLLTSFKILNEPTNLEPNFATLFLSMRTKPFFSTKNKSWTFISNSLQHRYN